jgi:ribose 5-phosphate isomerase B
MSYEDSPERTVRVGFGCDHRGFAAKQWVVGTLRQLGHECIDFGTDGRDPVDYPDIAYMVAKAVVETRVERAILVCSTGIGMPMAANKIKGIRATFCHDELSAHVARQHICANVLCLSADHTDEVLMCRIVEVWLNTEAGGGRHRRRIRKIEAIEDGRDPRGIE